jgi:leucyl-tRNA synthetase
MAFAGFAEMERKWRKRWDEARLFESEPDERKKFYITVAYPYPSGGMHVGHVRTYTMPDIVARFKRMQGYNVLFPMAWHVTGTPIIGAVNRLKNREKKQMHVLKDVFKVSDSDLEDMLTPMGYARYFINNHYVAGMRALGFSIDWRRQFTTNDLHYNRFVEWQHGILHRKGLEKEGLHPVKWCTNDGNPVTTHDLLEGESAEIQEFTLLKFPLSGGRGEMLVAATLRPETVFGQTNLWVNPETEYVKASVGKETWIISPQALEKLAHQNRTIEGKGTVKGEKLLGRMALAPGAGREVMVLPASFCDPDIGTGIVTSVPSDAPYDYIALKDLQSDEALMRKHGLPVPKVRALAPIPIITTQEFGGMAAAKAVERFGIRSQKDVPRLEEATKAVYKAGFHKGVMSAACGRYAGMKVDKAKELVRKDLMARGEADAMLEFSEKVVCRCGGKVIVAKSESWFLDYGNPEWKAQVRKYVESGLRLIPEGSRKDYLHTIDWLDKWPCVRNFGLGTRLPQDPRFMIEPLSDSTIYMAYYTISHMITRYEPESLVPEFFDFVMLGKGTAAAASKRTGIPAGELEDLRRSFAYWYPMDWRCSAVELVQNHLTFMLFHHAAVFPKEEWPRGIATWGVGLLEGGKMSSSKGNVVLASEAVEKYSADATRLFLFSSVEPWQDFDWRAREVENYRDRLMRFQKRVAYLSKHARKSELRHIDRWLVSEFNKAIRNTTEALEGFQTRKASLEAFFRMQDVMRWYERRSEGTMNRNIVLPVLENWLKLLTPFIPYTCEELWESLGGSDFISVSGWPVHSDHLIDERLERMEGLVKATLDDAKNILSILEASGAKEARESKEPKEAGGAGGTHAPRGLRPKEVRVYVSPRWKYEAHREILAGSGAGKDAKDRKGIIPWIMKHEVYGKEKDALRFAQALAKESAAPGDVLAEEEEYAALKSAEHFLREELGCPVHVFHSHESDSDKSRKADPGKPGIEVVG